MYVMIKSNIAQFRGPVDLENAPVALKLKRTPCFWLHMPMMFIKGFRTKFVQL